MRDPSSIDVIVVPEEGWDNETWMQALRSNEVPYYSSFPFYASPIPKVVSDSAFHALQDPSLLICRTLLNPDVIKVASCRPIVEAFFTIYRKIGKIHAFVAYLVSTEVNQTTDEAQIFRGNSYLTTLFKIYFERYSQTYIDEVINPIKDEVNAEGDLRLHDVDCDAEKVVSLTRSVVRRLSQSSDKLSPEFHHLLSILKVSLGLRFGHNEGVFNGLSGFFLLRFMSPMLLSECSNDVRSFTNVLQVIGNMGAFDAMKYPALAAANDRFRSPTKRLFAFVMSLGDGCGDTPARYGEEPGDAEVRAAVATLMAEAGKVRAAFIERGRKESLVHSKTPTSLPMMMFLRHLATND